MVSQRLLQVKEDTDPIVLRRGAILSVANNFDVSRSRTISKSREEHASSHMKIPRLVPSVPVPVCIEEVSIRNMIVMLYKQLF